MSKKKLLTIVLPCALVVVLVAVFLIVYFCCFASDIYSELGKIANAKHSNISVTITAEQDGETLTSSFEIHNSGNRSVINYSVENFAEINPDTGEGGDAVTAVGRVELVDGKVLQQSGDEVDINFGNVTKFTLYFAKDNFQDVKTENGIFSAKVTNPKAFMDSPSLVCKDMTVMFVYMGSEENVIVIAYTSEGGAAVTITYTFS